MTSAKRTVTCLYSARVSCTVTGAPQPSQNRAPSRGSVPQIGKSFADQLRDEPRQLNPALYKGLEFDGQSRAVWADVGLAQALIYADCDEPTAQAAIKRLRPQAAGGFVLPFSLAEFPAVSCTSIICSEDQLLNGEWAKRIARDRLGADLVELPGSHSPFLSRPSALADVLLHLAETSAEAASPTASFAVTPEEGGEDWHQRMMRRCRTRSSFSLSAVCWSSMARPA